MVQGYFRVKDAAKYAGVSERTFRDWLKAGLKCTRPQGKKTVLVKCEWIDEYLAGYMNESNRINEIAEDVLQSLR